MEDTLATLDTSVRIEEPAVDGRRARGEKTREAILARAVQIASAGGARGPFDRPARDGSRRQQERPVRPLRVQDRAAARHGRRGAPHLHPRGDRRRRAESGIGGLIGLTDSWLDYMRARRVPRRVFLRRRVARVRRPPGPGARPGRVDDGRVADGPRGRDPGRAGCGRACPGPRQRAARVRDQRARPGCELGLPALRRRCRIRTCAGGDPQGSRPRSNASRFSRDVDEGAARRTLRDQIAKLERELASLFVSAYPRRGAGLAGQLARRAAAARRRRPRGAPGPAGRARRGHPPGACARAPPPSRPAAGASRRWSPIPAATSGSGSPTTTSASPGASTTTRPRVWDWSEC